MKKFDVVRVFYIDIDGLIFFETPTDDVYRSAIKQQCESVGSFAMAYNATCITSIVGEIPFMAHWDDYVNNYFSVIGNVADGYTIDKAKFERLYNEVQDFIELKLESAEYMTFDEGKFIEDVTNFIKNQKL